MTKISIIFHCGHPKEGATYTWDMKIINNSPYLENGTRWTHTVSMKSEQDVVYALRRTVTLSTTLDDLNHPKSPIFLKSVPVTFETGECRHRRQKVTQSGRARFSRMGVWGRAPTGVQGQSLVGIGDKAPPPEADNTFVVKIC